MKLRAVVIDDEPLAISLLENYISRAEEIHFIAGFTDPITSIEFLKTNQVDLVLLDIEMPRLSGLELSKILPHDCRVIFTTAHRKFAIEAFDVNAVDYLLKPIRYNRFLEAIEKVTLRSKTPIQKKVTIRANRRDYILQPNQIQYIEGLKDYVKIFTDRGVLLSRGSIGAFLKKDDFNFLTRVHRSYAVNMDLIVEKTNTAVFINGKRISIGRKFRQ